MLPILSVVIRIQFILIRTDNPFAKITEKYITYRYCFFNFNLDFRFLSEFGSVSTFSIYICLHRRLWQASCSCIH